MKFSDETISRAKTANLVDYLMSQGESLTKEGLKSYRLKIKGVENFIITNNIYKNFYDESEKNCHSVNFLVKHRGMSFVQAVKALTGEQGDNGYIAPPKYIEVKRTLIAPVMVEDTTKTFNYLTQERKLSEELVNNCLNYGAIGQYLTTKNQSNALFKWHNEQGDLVGGDVVGVNGWKWKQVLAGSDTEYGFTVRMGESPTKLLFFEAPIDLLSYIDLYKDKLTNHILFSLGGLRKEKTIHATIKRYNIPYKEVYFCVDNTQDANDFVAELKAKYGIKRHLPPTKGNEKDWNDILKRGR